MRVVQPHALTMSERGTSEGPSGTGEYVPPRPTSMTGRTGSSLMMLILVTFEVGGPPAKTNWILTSHSPPAAMVLGRAFANSGRTTNQVGSLMFSLLMVITVVPVFLMVMACRSD